MRILRLFVVVLFSFCYSVHLNAQSCVPTNINGTIINLACNQTCIPLNFQTAHLKASGDYVLRSIPYNPNPYLSASGIEDPAIYADDRFGFLAPIPFPFCFYDSVFNNCVVGSNGIVTFDPANASCSNAYVINSPAPYAGGSICLISPAYYPRSSIMAAYSDLDPSPGQSPPERKVMWFTTGTAPNRKFIVSYYHVGVYLTPCGLSTPNTFQIVLNEASGLIEIFFEQKACFTTTNGGLAILGIQNWPRNRAVTAPGKNPGVWSENNTGYQFIPSAGASRFVSSQLFTLAGAFVTNVDTSTSQPGILDLSVLNLCPPAGNNTYVLRTTFNNCSGGPQIVYCDTIQVNRTNSLNATAATSPTACGPPSGTITVTVPPGIGTPPYTFVLDGIVTQVGASPMTFNNVTAGNHTIVVTDASGGCTSTINVNVASSTTIFAIASSTAASCTGINNGTITITPINGSAPYTYSVNGAPPVSGGVPYTVTNLAPGSYTVIVRDNSGCVSGLINLLVVANTGITASAAPTATSCNGANNGSITVTTTTGQAPFQYSINGGPQQPGNIFNNLAPGTYTIVVTDAAGCTRTLIQTISPGQPLLAGSTIVGSNLTCNGDNSGRITAYGPIIGIPPFQYSLDAINWQSSNIFNGLSAGVYDVYVRDASGCLDSVVLVQVFEPPVLLSSFITTPVVCNGQSNGIINITASGGTAPYEYSLDGGTYQASNIFNTVTAGPHTVTVRDANGCLRPQTITMTEPVVLSVTGNTVNASCDGGNDGVIVVGGAGGNSNYQYSINGINFQASNIFNVAPGTYTVTVRDNLNCTATRTNVVVGLNSNLTHTPLTDPTICEGSSAQINFTSNATNYSWSPAIGLSSTNTASTVANPTSTQQYIVSYTLARCTEEDTIVVNVNAAPIPNAGADGFICYGQSYQLQGSGGVVYNWTPSTFLSNTSTANPMVTPDNSMTYTMSIVADANNCPSLISDQMTVDVTPPIKVITFPKDTVVYAGDQFQLNAVSIANIYNWSPSFDLSNPNIPNPIISVNSDVIFTVTASTIAGCKGEGYVRVQVYKGPDIYMPTAFSPNGDGLNDLFKPFPVGIDKLNYFRVFNRWGQMVYSATTLHQGWDGKISGVAQASGTFAWIAQGVTRDGRLITKKGTVTLVR